MKRWIGMVILLVLSLSTVLAVTTAAVSSDVQNGAIPVVTTSLSDFWINDWNDTSRDRSIVAYNRGLDTGNVNFGSFSVYKEIRVVTPEVYYQNPTDAGFGLKQMTDLTPYKETGVLRFWIGVSKDMTVRVTLKSFDNAKYTEASVTVTLKIAEATDGYQAVEIPLNDFFGANPNWNAAYTRYVILGGVAGCDRNTFLDTDDILCVSPFEIWGNTPPEPVPYDPTPVFRDINGRTFIKDINGVLDKNLMVKSFHNTLEKEKYEGVVADYMDGAELLSLYTVNVVRAGSEDYALARLNGYVELYLPVTEEMRTHEITVAAYAIGGISPCEYTLTDDYLIINTNKIGTILIIDTNAPLFTADNMATGNDQRLVNDNVHFDKAVFFKRAIGSANEVIFNEQEIGLTDITDWIKNENGILRFWVKAPNRDGKSDIKLRIGLCLRYYVGTGAYYPQTTTVIAVPADGKWHEMRLSTTVFVSTAFDVLLDHGDYAATYDTFYVRVAAPAEEYNLAAAEGLYFTNFEFYKKDLQSPVSDGNIDKPYGEIITLANNPSWKTDSRGYIIRATGTDTELPFFTDTVTFTACDTFTPENASAVASTQLGIAYRDGVSCLDFAEWAYYNRDAELRFWIKTERDITFRLGILTTATGSNSEITAAVSCSAFDGWQEIRLKRSDFSYSNTFDDLIVGSDTRNIYFNFYVTEDTFTAGSDIAFARRVEFFTGPAYDKGDLTLDGVVDIMDFIRAKKLCSYGALQFTNGDIDSDGMLTALDIAYLRRWLLSGTWK